MTMLPDEDQLLWERGEWRHLPNAILEAYVDETLDPIDREIVEGHLLLCPACVAEARDLRALRLELATYPTVAAATVSPEPATQFAQAPAAWRWVWPVLTGATVAAALIWLAIVLPLGRRLAESEQGAARLVAERDQARAGRAVAVRTGNENKRELQQAQKELDRLSNRIALTPQATPPPAPSSLPSPTPRIVVPRPAEPALPAAVEGLIASVHLPIASLASLQTTPTVLRGAEEQPPIAVAGPKATRVLSDRPVFRWLPVADADHYEVLVADEKDHILARSQVIRSTTFWQTPKPLPRGKPLTWEVDAVTADGKLQAASATSRFLILPEPTAKRLKEAQIRWSAAQPLAWAALAAQAGLRAEAEATLLSVLESLSASESDRKKALRWLDDLREKTAEAPAPSATPSPTPEAVP